MIVDRCVVTAETTAAACVEQLFLDDALAHHHRGRPRRPDGRHGGAAAQPHHRGRRRRLPARGGRRDARGEPAHGRARAGPCRGPLARGDAAPPRRATRSWWARTKPRADDPVREAGVSGLRQTAPKVKVTGRVGPAEIRTVERPGAAADRPQAVQGRHRGGPRSSTAWTRASLATLPEDLKLVAWTCSDAVSELLDLASRLRGCVARADDAAGEAAANVVLAIKTSRDVPDTHRDPGLRLSRHRPGRAGASWSWAAGSPQTAPAPTDGGAGGRGGDAGRSDRRHRGAGGAGRPRVRGAAPDPHGHRGGGRRRSVRPSTTCVGAKGAARVCVDDLVEQGVAMIVPIATGGDLTGPARRRDRGRRAGHRRQRDAHGRRRAPSTSTSIRAAWRAWPGAWRAPTPTASGRAQPVDVVVFNDEGARADDSIASVVERALIQTDSDICVVARLASKSTAAGGQRGQDAAQALPVDAHHRRRQRGEARRPS